MPRVHTDRRERRNPYEKGIYVSAPPSGMMKRRDEENDPNRSKTDALKDAQGTRVETQLVLRVERVSEQSDTGGKACEIDQPPVIQTGS